MKKFLIITAIILLAIAACLFFALKSSNKSYVCELKLVSPDKENVLVIKEYDYLAATGAEIYLENDERFVKDNLLGQTTAEGGCYPFRDGNYLIEWGADFITIKYYSGTESEKPELSSTWKTKEFHF